MTFVIPLGKRNKCTILIFHVYVTFSLAEHFPLRKQNVCVSQGYETTTIHLALVLPLGTGLARLGCAGTGCVL